MFHIHLASEARLGRNCILVTLSAFLHLDSRRLEPYSKQNKNYKILKIKKISLTFRLELCLPLLLGESSQSPITPMDSQPIVTLDDLVAKLGVMIQPLTNEVLQLVNKLRLRNFQCSYMPCMTSNPQAIKEHQCLDLP